ncbi:hypothetical protein TA3x_004425 [Tundrisphaera sp. TA3]|uniref:hypothetical protein n=1 Tax=Tundrisphaera sp. TA3 TaxID=3435775 RepID=UPI003EC04508
MSPPTVPIEPRVIGESAYDRVTSLLLALILGALIVFGWLSIIAATSLAYATRVARPVQIIEVAGGGGGRPDGQMGGVESVNVPGGAAADKASNNEEEAPDFEEPSVEARPSALLDAATDPGQELAEVDVGAVMPNGGRVASGKRRSRVGNGMPGFGFGPGDGGVSREDRWSIVFKTGQTPDEYARQLDALGVELAIVSGNQLAYYSKFSQARPERRLGSGANDRRLYFVWRGQGRKESDLALLAKAGAEVGEGVIFQFYPDKVEETLAQLEVRYKGRQPGEIRSTRFGVVQLGSGYGFEVISQEGLR